jgi:hypothetical protein
LRDDPGIGGPTERAALSGALTQNGQPKEEILHKGMEYGQIEEILHA